MSQALDQPEKPRGTRAGPPPRAGLPWDDEQDAKLIQGFDQGEDLKVLAHTLGRTRFGIEQRLIKLGKISAPTGGRFGASARPAG